MSHARSTSRRIVEVLKNSGDERRRAASERRSSARPAFVEGWRKAVGQSLAPISRRSTASPFNRIDIWTASSQSLLRAKSCLQILTDKDWASLVLIQDPSNRNSAIAARVLLRLGLSHAIERKIAPQEWDFSLGDRQQPLVAVGLPQVHFSVSHTEQLALVAISPSLNVGVDVECVDQNVTDEVMAEFCHVDEMRSVKELSDAQKLREFIRLWTLKEAYTKMMGAGHSLDFKMIKFMLDPNNLASIDNHEPDTGVQFENFYVSLNHALFHASLAIEGPISSTHSTEVRIINLSESVDLDTAFAAPSCS